MNETNGEIKGRRPFYFELSFWSLLTANIVSIAWALKKDLSLDLMLWVYFFQSIILGIFWPAKVIDSLEDSSYAKKMRAVIAFSPIYFFMHLLLAFSLHGFFGKELAANFKYILVMSGIFFLSETVSYIFDRNDNCISIFKQGRCTNFNGSISATYCGHCRSRAR